MELKVVVNGISFIEISAQSFVTVSSYKTILGKTGLFLAFKSQFIL